MHDVAMRRRLQALVIAALLAMLVVGGAMLFGMGKPAQSQETTPPCDVSFCIDKTADADTVEVGQQITFTITQRCIAGGRCLDSNAIVDELPSGLSFVSVEDSDPDIQCTRSGNTVTCPGTRIFTSDSPFTATIVATTTECGTFTNTASIPGPGETDQVSFTVVRCPPPTKEECKNGGWEEFGFPDQGTCVSAVNRQNRQNRQ